MNFSGKLTSHSLSATTLSFELSEEHISIALHLETQENQVYK